MISFGNLPIKRNLYGEHSLRGFGISEAPVYTLPQYIIPGNVLVIPVGPLGSWNLRVRRIWYKEGGGQWYKFYTGMDFDCELIVFPSNGSFSSKFIDRSSFGTNLPKSLTDISFSYNRSTGGIHIDFKKNESVGDLKILGNTISGDIAMGVRMSELQAPLYSPESILGGVYGGLYEVTGKKRSIELFVPLTTKTIIPSIVTGLTVVETGTQILMEQGASRGTIVAAPLHPSPYIPPGGLMVVLINIPHGLWKISYIVGGIENRGQLEIAEFGGQLVGRMNVSGGMLYGSSGWESISNIQRSGASLSFIRDYTRQTWEGIISEDSVSGIYGGGFSKGGGTWNGLKEPVEIFIPTDITQYTKEIVVTKEMPLATLIPIETVSGKATGAVIIEGGFAPTEAQAVAAAAQITSLEQAVPITLAIAKTSVAPITDVLKLAQEEAVVQEGFPVWILFLLAGTGIFLLSGKGIEKEKKGKRR